MNSNAGEMKGLCPHGVWPIRHDVNMLLSETCREEAAGEEEARDESRMLRHE